MLLNPEAQIIAINAGLLLLAYGVIYPSIREISIGTMVAIDAVLSVLSLVIAGWLYWGEGIRFSLLLFSTNWVVFSILTMAVMEMPLFRWFCHERGLDPFPAEDDDDR